FLEDLEADPSLKPDEDWDDAIVALVNYPEVVEMMNDDLDWTWQLGEAVVAQQSDVIAAIATFRDKAHAAGNLKSDDRQMVTRNDEDVIEIEPVSEEVIFVPYYEPTRVVVYQPQPVYYYYPRAYPVYYYPYPAWHSFSHGYFWGVTTAFTIGWNAHCLNVYHPTFYGHPYYGYSYHNAWWYRRPSVTVYNNYYYDQRVVRNRYEQGDQWRPRGNTRLHYADQRITRNSYYPNPATAGTVAQSRTVATGQRVPQAEAAPPRGARSRNGDDVREIRQALEASGSPRPRNVAVPRTGSADARQNPDQRAPSVREVRDALAENRDTRQAPRDTRQAPSRAPSVREVRDALAGSRDNRQAQNGRESSAERTTVPARRPAVPAARPDATVERPALPAERPTIRTWSDARNAARAPATAQSPQSAPAPRQSRPQNAPAPAQRAPANPGAARQATPSRPAPAARAPANARAVESRAPAQASSSSARSSARPASRTR
ncbi:MAG TPA: DUF3300 domain-containing protein, partial [Woeseiaceae bacterium]|nr:DUF3300 domain-containing protein [Woeseiaceae bacterium]